MNCPSECAPTWNWNELRETVPNDVLKNLGLFCDSFWENIILARDLEVLESIYLFRLTFQTYTVRHQNITKLKCQDVKLDQLSRCQNEKVRVKIANKNITWQQNYINSVPGRAAGAPDHWHQRSLPKAKAMGTGTQRNPLTKRRGCLAPPDHHYSELMTDLLGKVILLFLFCSSSPPFHLAPALIQPPALLSQGELDGIPPWSSWCTQPEYYRVLLCITKYYKDKSSSSTWTNFWACLDYHVFGHS